MKTIMKHWRTNRKSVGLLAAVITGFVYQNEWIDLATFTSMGLVITGLTGVMMYDKPGKSEA